MIYCDKKPDTIYANKYATIYICSKYANKYFKNNDPFFFTFYIL